MFGFNDKDASPAKQYVIDLRRSILTRDGHVIHQVRTVADKGRYQPLSNAPLPAVFRRKPPPPTQPETAEKSDGQKNEGVHSVLVRRLLCPEALGPKEVRPKFRTPTPLTSDLFALLGEKRLSVA